MNLYQDDAVTGVACLDVLCCCVVVCCVVGEAAGLAMGLVMVGSSSPEAIDDMVKVCFYLPVVVSFL